MRILFDSKLSQFKTPFGVLHPGKPCTMHIQIPVSCRTTRVQLLLLRENCGTEREIEMSLQERGELYECYGCTFALERAELYFYCFRITTANEQFRLFKQGNDTNMEAGDLWQLSCVEERYPVPEALRGAVMYQIFPDRFYQSGVCDCAEKLRPYYVHESRDELPVYLPNEHGEMLNNDFFGGNLNGIREKLPYLHGLGVEILYLNPIFMAFSNHRYDTYDYKRVDPMLGTEADFTALCEAAHVLGMKIVLDGVFSHVGSRSPYFQSAISDPASPYRSWFRFLHYPDIYESWWGITTLPCVDKSNESYIRYIIEDEDSVLAHWLRLGADGFRLDVVDELPDAFVERLRRRLRELDPEAILIGEVWEDASNKVSYGALREYFLGSELDATMHYPFRTAVLDFLQGKINAQTACDTFWTIQEHYPKENLYAALNLIGSHDRARVLTVLGGDVNALKMAMFLQFALPGVPSIYYGDEAGMTGGTDPYNRGSFPWGKGNAPLTDFVRSLTAMYQETPLLRRGECEMVFFGENVLGCRRFDESGSVLALVNRGEEAVECFGVTVPGRGYILE